MASDREREVMRLAIALSALGIATTSPNPPVGCVILGADGEIVGTGHTRPKGGPHAERVALDAAGDRAKGGTVVVTLEPCNHIGRTPACHQGLIDAEVSRVVIALIDPTSRGVGGAARLREAGIDVEVSVLADEASIVLGPWLGSLTRRRPAVTALLAEPRSPATDSLLAAERLAVDAIVYASGLVEEGSPNTHGEGVLNLPPTRVSGDPQAIMRALFDGGVRSVVVEVDHARLRDYVAAGCLDKAFVLVSNEAAPTLPVDLRLTVITRTADGVLVEMRPLDRA